VMSQNDIDIVDNDRVLSRSHFCIDYSSGFKQYRDLPNEWLSFFMINDTRLGRYCNVPALPSEITFNILSYTATKRQFFIADNESTYGTHLKIKYDQPPVKVSKGDSFLLGCDYIIKIIDICTGDISAIDLDEDNLLAYIQISIMNGDTIIGNFSSKAVGDTCFIPPLQNM
jgi:hypothetical protein